MHYSFTKRILDIIVSSCALVILSPVLLAVAILVRVKLGKPIIFKQSRPGLEERIFTLYKFRTMTNRCDNEGKILPDEIRLTKFGKTLRSLSLDELPELINILKGDMSIVGPRPLLVHYLPLYSDRQRIRHKVRPGLTGLAQVNGRNLVSWDDRLDYDINYVQNMSFINDVKIIIKTIGIVFRKEGINSETAATMEEFKGNKKME